MMQKLSTLYTYKVDDRIINVYIGDGIIDMTYDGYHVKWQVGYQFERPWKDGVPYGEGPDCRIAKQWPEHHIDMELDMEMVLGRFAEVLNVIVPPTE